MDMKDKMAKVLRNRGLDPEFMVACEEKRIQILIFGSPALAGVVLAAV